MDLRIAIISGGLARESVRIAQGKFVIGREPTCNLAIDDPFVSGFHCMLLLDEHALLIQDLDSKNGTYLNGNRLGSAHVIVNRGDIISIGAISFRIESNADQHPSVNIQSDATLIDENAPAKEDAGHS